MPARYIYRKFIHRILQINDTPESLALGTALGTFVAMTPTGGIQMLLVLILNTVCRANRVAGIIMTYITNPFTIVPIYWISYMIGVWALGMEPVTLLRFEEVILSLTSSLNPTVLWASLQSVNHEIILPTFVGGAVLGVLTAIPVYPITLRLARSHQRRRAHLQGLERARELQRADSLPAAAEPVDSAAAPEPEATEVVAAAGEHKNQEGPDR